MLAEFGTNIWIADGQDPVTVAGFHYPTRMAVIKLADGELFVWSPIQLSPDLRQAIENLGPVRHIVAPNHLHHLFMPEWINAFPDARVHGAPGLAKKRPDIRFDAELGDTPAPEWAGQIDQVLVKGNLITTETVFFHTESATVLFTDLLQQFPAGWFSGWRQTVARLDRMVGAEPAVPRKFRVTFTNRRAARLALKKIYNWPAEKVLIAHGKPVESGGAAFLRRAFSWLG